MPQEPYPALEICCCLKAILVRLPLLNSLPSAYRMSSSDDGSNPPKGFPRWGSVAHCPKLKRCWNKQAPCLASL